jgi:hypothetical protein
VSRWNKRVASCRVGAIVTTGKCKQAGDSLAASGWQRVAAYLGYLQIKPHTSASRSKATCHRRFLESSSSTCWVVLLSLFPHSFFTYE